MAEPVRRRLVDAAWASRDVPSRVAALAAGVLHGVWLGVLTEDDLAALDERYYSSNGFYATDEWNERGLFEWEQRLVDDVLDDGQRVLVLAAGGGREVLALLERGFDAVGYESHPDLARAAEDLLARRGHAGRVHVAPRDALPDDAPAADAVIIGWGAYSLLRDRAHRVAVLAAAAARLPPGGPVLLSYLERQEDLRRLRVTRTVANALRRVRRAAPVELGDALAPNRVHHLSPAELAAEAEAAGLVITHRAALAQVDRATRHACAVARKR